MKTLLVILGSFVLVTGNAKAQCNSDSIIYKLTLTSHCGNDTNINDKVCRYLTIEYTPIEPDLWGIIHIKNVDMDSMMVKELFRINDTLSINYHASHLNKMYRGDPEVIIINRKDFIEKKITAKNFWKRFWKVYPQSGGLMSVSAIAYNADCTEAIFYFENVHQWLVGGGYLAICHLEKDEWGVKHIIGVLQM